MIKLRSFSLALITIMVPLTLSSCLPPLQGKSVEKQSLQKQSLQGGSQLIIELQTTPSVPKIDERELKAVMRIIEGRIKGLGISQAVVRQIEGKNQILVQLPGIKDPTQAIRVLGSTAQLEFKKQKLGTKAQLYSLLTSRNELKSELTQLQKTKNTAAIAKNQAKLKQNNQAISLLFASNQPSLTGRYLNDAFSSPTEAKTWEIGISFDQQGGDLFAAITKELAGTGRSIGIFIDNELISSPFVSVEFAKTGITGGKAVITGNFSANDAKELAAQLRGGALPVPIKIKAVTSLPK
jgi:preprotein translocase subunit SecD